MLTRRSLGASAAPELYTYEPLDKVYMIPKVVRYCMI